MQKDNNIINEHTIVVKKLIWVKFKHKIMKILSLNHYYQVIGQKIKNIFLVTGLKFNFELKILYKGLFLNIATFMFTIYFLPSYRKINLSFSFSVCFLFYEILLFCLQVRLFPISSWLFYLFGMYGTKIDFLFMKTEWIANTMISISKY